MRISAIGDQRHDASALVDSVRHQMKIPAPHRADPTESSGMSSDMARVGMVVGAENRPAPATFNEIAVRDGDSDRRGDPGGIIGCVGCSLPKKEPMSSDREKSLDAQIREEVSDDPDALAAYENLLETDLFTRSSLANRAAESRVALLEQVKNYPEAEIIDDLGRLGERDWFGEQTFEDKQRSAKMIAFNVSERTPDNNGTRENTIDRILDSDDVDVGWQSISSDPGTVTYGRAGEKGMLWWKTDYIYLNRDLVPSGSGKIDPNDDKAVHVVANTLAHEVNHTITPGGNEQSYGYFMDEYRAWYVGYEAENGHPPSAREAYDRASYLTSSTSGSYGNIGKAFRDTGSDDQKDIVAFMARIMGLDPSDATYDHVNDMNNFDNDGTAPPPVSAFSDDPNNINND